MLKIGFVVLHYLDFETTSKCVGSILQQAQNYYTNPESIQKNVNIVIVDNASPNDSGKRLQDKFKNQENIKVIRNGSNLGFAKGNNIGYQYIRNKVDIDFMFVLNNDIIIEQNNFFEVLLKHSKKLAEFEIISPDILTKLKEHQNPFRKKPLSDTEIERIIFRNKLHNFLFNKPIINKVYLAFLDKTRESRFIFEENDWEKEQEMVVPHGACIIYSKKWIQKEEYAFNPNTFMYFEEDILYKYILIKNYKTLYFPELQILHLEDISTNQSISSIYKKRAFIAKNSLDSLKVYKNLK